MAHPYERTVAELMVDAANGLNYPASRSDVVAWFAEHYPDLKASTVRAHIVGLTANDRSRHHYTWLAKRAPLFVRNESRALTAFEGVDSTDPDNGDSVEEEEGAPPLEFALEAFLEEFLLTNWEGIDWGRPVELWESGNGEIGHQLATPVGRLDFLCRDTATGALVVIELKRGRPSDRVVGQTARYMGWVRAELAKPDQKVEGLIVAHEQDPQLYYAVSAVPDLEVLTYTIQFTLSVPDRPA